MKLTLDYNFGDEFYVITDPQQSKRLLTGVSLRPSGILLILACNGIEDTFFEFEVSTEEDVNARLGLS